MPSFTMIFQSALLILWAVPISNAAGRLRQFYLTLREPEMQINDALNACRTNYTDLVTIYDQEENVKLTNMSSKSCAWIGANSCTWPNGDPVTFNNFNDSYPEERCCGALTAGGTWECFNCSLQMYFMCDKQNHSQHSSNYSLIPENKTWFEAQLYCKNNQSDLVSIRNETENERVKEAVNGNNSFWIGLQYNYKVTWFDGGHSDYEHQYLSKGCFTSISNISEYWLKYNNNNTCNALCYKSFIHVGTYNMSWEDALDYCNDQSDTLGLLRIESEDDQIETERELNRQNISGPVWVGLRQSRLFGFWIWSNGLFVGPWTNWKEGSAPEHLISEHCGVLEKVNGTFKWSDKDCRSEFKVLCERK